MFDNLYKVKTGKTLRCSSWEKNGRNSDSWKLQPGESRVIADIKGPGKLTHIWMTQGTNYRNVLIKITWDNAEKPSVLCPLGDFFGLGHSIVNSYQCLLFSASTAKNNQFNQGCALNCYVPMPFKQRAVIELINESKTIHNQYFYIDYEAYDEVSILGDDMAYFHAEFHRENPFGGWAHEIRVNSPEANIANKEKLAWDNNYVILETKGKGQYIGCNYSVSNFQGTWWGEGDDMIWVDGYKWPPDLHGTGSEDYLNQAWGMQDNAFLHNGSSIFENNTNGYQTSYVHHIENPVRFEKEIKVTIEFGHGNHLRNEVSTVAYWYAVLPTAVKEPPSVEKRQPVMQKDGKWVFDKSNQITTFEVELNDEMKKMKRRWKGKDFPGHIVVNGLLQKDDTNCISLKMKLARDNPNLYDIPLTDLLEEFLNEEIVLKGIKGDRVQGQLMELGDETMGIKIGEDACSVDKLVAALFPDDPSQTVELEVLKLLDDEIDAASSAKYILTIAKSSEE